MAGFDQLSAHFFITQGKNRFFFHLQEQRAWSHLQLGGNYLGGKEFSWRGGETHHDGSRFVLCPKNFLILGQWGGIKVI